jgi:hypothetical protein
VYVYSDLAFNIKLKEGFMKKVLALTGVLSSPMALALVAMPKVAGILLALLQLGSSIGFGTLVNTFLNIIFFGGVLLPGDFVFLL